MNFKKSKNASNSTSFVILQSFSTHNFWYTNYLRHCDLNWNHPNIRNVKVTKSGMSNHSWRLPRLFSWRLRLLARCHEVFALSFAYFHLASIIVQISSWTRGWSRQINHDYPMNYLLDDGWTIATIISSPSKEVFLLEEQSFQAGQGHTYRTIMILFSPFPAINLGFVSTFRTESW